MDNGPGWLPDPEDGDRERYWNGSDWTDRVRPAGKGRSLHLPEHVPELQRALAAATADIDAVEDRLSTMFDRADSPAPPSTTPIPSAGQDTDDPDGNGAFAELNDERIDLEDEADTEPIHEEFADPSEDDDEDGAFAELDAALAAEEAEEPETSERRLFRRRP
ncbi:MAG: DUF2510 domain-containing protein [Acidimicrobiales bacterium]